MRIYFLSCVLVKPFLLLCIPTDSWHLHSSSREFNKILLQGCVSKCIFHFIIIVPENTKNIIVATTNIIGLFFIPFFFKLIFQDFQGHWKGKMIVLFTLSK